ncbi:PaaX family transcriptional regulator C-terminal domain-containing protein [Nocardia sp. alder85J]|uniref:PaaX family transcriptional regulator n=1 Tax=Nocardia sp. alder85J TaxID=2862949 RepID=UPI001CD7542A|nr:PaaX family transcriptional regulator C-terminal domain-containing protein [Nocardia sp. alder85J]MCX4096696.1 phenylacetic acid degradation protein PaaX [Nocardia sp. alder85J]
MPDTAPTPPTKDWPARSARSTLLTALGELVEPYRQPVRTAALLYVLEGLGFGAHASRQAVARTGSAGLIAPRRDGRETLWSLTDKAHRLFTEGDVRVFSTDIDPARWDGQWLVLNVAIPESHRATRKKLYAALRWAGFGNPTPGTWVTPHTHRAAEAAQAIDALGLTENSLSFIGTTSAAGISEEDLVRRSWDLAAAEAAYDELLERFDSQRFTTADEQLFAHVELADSLRRMTYMDPRLPEVLLPHWRGQQAAKRLRDLRAEWTTAAHAQWHRIAGLG